MKSRSDLWWLVILVPLAVISLASLGFLGAVLVAAVTGSSPIADWGGGHADPVGADSTLEGGTVTGDGWSIRQVDAAEVPGETLGEDGWPLELPLVYGDDRTIYLESGGSGTTACLSHFRSIELTEQGELRLLHSQQDPRLAAADLVCTDDYRLTWFEIEAGGDTTLADVRTIAVYSADWEIGGDPAFEQSFSSDDWASGAITTAIQ